MNPYQILEIDEDADEDEIKEAYREKAKEHHPDQGGDEEKFKQVQEAYENITDEERTGFDDKNPFGKNAPNFDGRYKEDKNVEDFIRDFEEFARGGGFNGGFAGGVDPFKEKRREFGNGPFKQAQQQQNIVYQAVIDFKTAVLGGQVNVQMSDQSNVQTLQVPPGMKNGTKVKYEGNKTVKFQVNNNTRYWRENDNDIYTTKLVSVWDAMTGADLEVQTLQGKIIKLTIAPGTSPDELFRIPGEGGSQTHDGKPQGDMYVKININIPAVTDENKQKLIEELRNE